MADILSNDKIKIAAARVLIEERRYETARELLKGVATRQALDWVLKLDSLIPKKKRKFNWLAAVLVALFAVCLVLFSVILIREHENQQRIWQAQKLSAYVTLSTYCEDGDYARYDSCSDWALNTINANLSLTDIVVDCGGDLLSLLTLDSATQKDRQDQTYACLGSKGIIPSSSISSGPSPVELTSEQIVKMNDKISTEIAGTQTASP